MSDGTIVYQVWPVETIRAAYEEFRDAMYDGAGPDELVAGLLCLDFLTRRSEVPDPLATFIDATVEQAEIRIALMQQKEAEERTAEENFKNVKRSIEILQIGVRSIQKLIDSYKDEDQVREMIQRRMRYLRGEV